MSILVILLLFLRPSSAQTQTSIRPGATLAPPSAWPSPSGDFAFGFRPLDSDPSLFLLSVFYPKLPARTVVWSANGARPVSNRSAAALTPDGQLVLTDGKAVVWTAGVSGATSASMLDTGNFVLSGAGGGPAWQTFDNPTDTILPGQTLREGASVYARLMDGDYSAGRFELAVQGDGNLVLYPVAYPTRATYDAYWSTNTFGRGVSLVFNVSGSVDLVFADGSKVPVMAAPALGGDYYLRATLDPDGAFRQYSFRKGSKPSTGGWTIVNIIAADVCNRVFGGGSGVCGFNSFCVPDAEGKASCLCPPHYSFLDPARKFRGCKPGFPAQPCRPGGEKPFGFERVVNVDWPLSDAERFSPVNETECAGNCLRDCFCGVAIYNSQMSNGTCWKKKFPLSNGRMGGDVNRIAFIKYSNSSASPAGPAGAIAASVPPTMY